MGDTAFKRVIVLCSAGIIIYHQTSIIQVYVQVDITSFQLTEHLGACGFGHIIVFLKMYEVPVFFAKHIYYIVVLNSHYMNNT